jgi:UDP-glucose 4-epimerase
MKNILITGGNGFIGSHLVDRLALLPDTNVTVFDMFPRVYGSLPPRVKIVQGNLNDISLVRRTLDSHSIDLVYHTAWANIHETSLKNVVADLENNLVPTLGLLETCRDVGVKRLIFLSSGGTIYGIPNSLPMREDHSTNPINAYGVTKLTVEKYIRMYSHLYGLEYVILRPSVPYGPRQPPHRRQGVISVFIYNALLGTPVRIWGDGNNIIRGYFYIQDLIEALVRVGDIQLVGEAIYNLDGVVSYSLNDIIRIIQSVLNVVINVQNEPPRPFDVPHLVLDISRATNAFGWLPHTSLEEGIINTAEWIKRYYE